MTVKNPVEFKDDGINVLGSNLMPSPDYQPPKSALTNDMVPTNQSPMAMMIQAKQAGFTAAEIKEMMDLQDRNDARIAKQAFYKALSEFKKNPPKIIKDKLNTQFGSNYVSIGNMVNTVNESMGEFGLTARWEFPETKDKTQIACTCFLAHELGHEISVTLDSPIDSSGAKNPLQGRKSTRTYLKLETFEAVTGMASSDGNVDDDGNSASKRIKTISMNKQNTIHSMLVENDLDIKIFLGWLGATLSFVDSIEGIPEDKYAQVVQKIKKSIEQKSKKV